MVAPGTHFWDAFNSNTTGNIGLFMNVPTNETNWCVQMTGTSKFSNYGDVVITDVGDSVTWEWSYYVLGYTAMDNVAPTTTGGATKYNLLLAGGNQQQ